MKMNKDGRNIKEIQIFCQDRLKRLRQKQLQCSEDHLQFSYRDGLLNEYKETDVRLSDFIMAL